MEAYIQKKHMFDKFWKFRETLSVEKTTRERNEEAMLQILENMSDGSSSDL